MFDLIHEVMRARTESTGSNIQILLGSGDLGTAEVYLYPFKSGSYVQVVYSLDDSGDKTMPLTWLGSGDYTYHALTGSGTPSYSWIAIGLKGTQN